MSGLLRLLSRSSRALKPGDVWQPKTGDRHPLISLKEVKDDAGKTYERVTNLTKASGAYGRKFKDDDQGPPTISARTAGMRFLEHESIVNPFSVRDMPPEDIPKDAKNIGDQKLLDRINEDVEKRQEEDRTTRTLIPADSAYMGEDGETLMHPLYVRRHFPRPGNTEYGLSGYPVGSRSRVPLSYQQIKNVDWRPYPQGE